MKPKAPIPTLLKGLTKGINALIPSKIKVYKSEDGSSMITLDAHWMNDPAIDTIFLELYTRASPFASMSLSYPYLSVSYSDRKGKFKKEVVIYREGECTQLIRLIETIHQDVLPNIWYEPLPALTQVIRA